MTDFKSIFDRLYVAQFSDAIGAESEVAEHLWLELSTMEMKARATRLGGVLASRFGSVAELDQALTHLLESGEFVGFRAWPMTCAVETFARESPEIALSQLKQWTKVFTGEFAVRPLLAHHFDLCMKEFQGWREDENEHVRRLVSEGTRPRLPWGVKVSAIDQNPERVVDLIRPLRLDESPYVRRSVANHMNDWTRLNPQLGKGELAGWGDGTREREVKARALRTLVKAGDADALRILGYSGDLKLGGFECSRVVEFPGALHFTVVLSNPSDSPVECVLDYAIAHAGKASNRSPKVFKWKTMRVPPGGQVTVSKAHTFRPITTRRYYTGSHTWSCQVNGQQLASAQFELIGVP